MIFGATDAEGIVMWDMILGLFHLPLWFINIAWPQFGPLILFEKVPGLYNISQSDIDIANIVKGFYIKPFPSIVTQDNLPQLVQLTTDAVFQ